VLLRMHETGLRVGQPTWSRKAIIVVVEDLYVIYIRGDACNYMILGNCPVLYSLPFCIYRRLPGGHHDEVYFGMPKSNSYLVRSSGSLPVSLGS